MANEEYQIPIFLINGQLDSGKTRLFCPRGLGMIPYQLPSSVELADATIKELADYDVVMWEKHGIVAVDRDVMAAFDQIDVLNKSALIYIAARIWDLSRTV